MSQLTITLPESLLNETHQAAKASQKSLQGFVLQVLAERVQHRNGAPPAKSPKTRIPKNGNRSKHLGTTPKPNSNRWQAHETRLGLD